MAMRIEKSFRIAAAAEPVWAFLTDPRRVASCLPGASITDAVDAETYNGAMTIKVGPVTAAYRGKMRFERLDPVAREAEIVASGQETRGKGAADMRMNSRVVALGPAETEVFVTSEVNVVGVLAQFGGRMIQDVSDQMFEKFTQAMRRQLETPAGEAPVAGAPAVATGPAPAVAPPAAVGGPEAAAPVAKAPVAAAGPPAVVAPAEASLPASAPPEASRPAAAPPPQEEVLDLGALGAAAAGRAAGRVLRSPLLWIALALLAALLWVVLR
jgi:uncharacterized protein